MRTVERDTINMYNVVVFRGDDTMKMSTLAKRIALNASFEKNPQTEHLSKVIICDYIPC